MGELLKYFCYRHFKSSGFFFPPVDAMIQFADGTGVGVFSGMRTQPDDAAHRFDGQHEG